VNSSGGIVANAPKNVHEISNLEARILDNLRQSNSASVRNLAIHYKSEKIDEMALSSAASTVNRRADLGSTTVFNASFEA
jgi:hypothetical protein